MSEYQPSFKKIELNKNGLANSINFMSRVNASSIQDMNQSTVDNNTNQLFHSQTNNHFNINQQSKYEYNASISLTKDSNLKGDIFDFQLPIKIRQSGKEDTKTILNLKIFASNKGNSQSQILRLELTDEQNHLFLFLMELTETEFLHVKNEQNLHVDFYSFPQQFSERLELCLNQDSDKKIQYFCMLDIKNNNEADFNIIEMNHFKSLTHLSLKLRKANDEIIKNFLAKKLQISKNENQGLKNQNEKLENDLNKKYNEVRIIEEQIKKLIEEKKRTIEEIKLYEQSKYQQAQQDYLQKEEMIRRQYETYKYEFDQKYREDIELYQDKYEMTFQKCQHLSEKLIEIEAQLKEFKIKTTTLEKESAFNINQIEDLKSQNRELCGIRFENEKKITELSFINKGMTKQIEDKENLLVNNKDLVDNQNSQKDMLKQQCDEYKNQILKLEQKFELCSEEIIKGNKIIEKLQDELQKLKNKIKIKNQVVIKQESFLEEIQQKNQELNNELLKKDREINKKDLKVREQDSQINDYKQKILESQKIIENNQSMIQYLNKQMNEGGIKNSMISTISKPLQSYSQYPSYENKYSSNYLTNSNLSRKYSYLEIHSENIQSNLSGATSPYSKTKETQNNSNPIYSSNTNQNTVVNRPSYTPRVNQDNDLAFTNKYNNQNSGKKYNNQSSGSKINNLLNSNSKNTYKCSTQQNDINFNNCSDTMSYIHSKASNNNLSHSFTQSGQQRNLQKYKVNQKDEEIGEDQIFSKKYLSNSTNMNQNFNDETIEEPQRVTPIKYRQPKNPN